MKDIVLVKLGDPPSAITILVELFATPNDCPTTCVSPKSVASPVVEIVTNSIVLVELVFIITPRVDEDDPA